MVLIHGGRVADAVRSRLERFSRVSHTKFLVPTLCVGMPLATLLRRIAKAEIGLLLL